MAEAWLLGALAAITVVHVLLLVATLRIRREARRSGNAGDADGGGEAVDCPDCGTANQPEYRFCRRCVTELPGAGSPGSRASGAAGRRTL